MELTNASLSLSVHDAVYEVTRFLKLRQKMSWRLMQGFGFAFGKERPISFERRQFRVT
jgi:hypothetical protein